MNAGRSIRIHLILGLAAALLLLGAIVGWAGTSEFAGAVIAQGSLVVDTNVKKVQHPTGGVVAELRVREGDMVQAGDVVIKLDDAQTRANLAIVSHALDDLKARQAREEAEINGSEGIKFPGDLIARQSDPEVDRILAGESALFEIRRRTRQGLRRQLEERISQYDQEIRGLTAQVSSKDKQVEWIKKELEGVRALWDTRLVPFTRVTALEREQARLEGERGQLIASIAQSKGKIAETSIQVLQIDQDMRTEDGKDLADIRGKTAELNEKMVAAEDQLKRIYVRAPQSGMVHQLDVHTVGGVISAGQQIMLIVPVADKLIVEAKVQPQDIDQIHIGQVAVVRFTNFNSRTTPELNCEVSFVSGDTTQDQRTGVTYYTVRVAIAPSQIEQLGGVKLVPGMPVEIFVQTQIRTVMSYLMRPFQDQVARVFREK